MKYSVVSVDKVYNMYEKETALTDIRSLEIYSRDESARRAFWDRCDEFEETARNCASSINITVSDNNKMPNARIKYWYQHQEHEIIIFVAQFAEEEA